MVKHRNPWPKVPKRPSPDNPDAETGVLIRLLYEDLVEVEPLAVTADEAVTNLPPRPRGQVRQDAGPTLYAGRQDLGTRAGGPGNGARSWSSCARRSSRSVDRVELRC